MSRRQARGPPPPTGICAVMACTSFRRRTPRPGANDALSAG